MRRCLFINIMFLAILLLAASCNPSARWQTDDVEITSYANVVSAGFVEFVFSTNKDAYYFIDCKEAVAGVDPMASTNQKQFMMMALDSASLKYLEWRNQQLKRGEFNIAPFSSHVLQYGNVHHFFTGLRPDTEYWVYCFVVDPELNMPVGRLNLVTVKTMAKPTVRVHFDYRVNGYWDYIYPLNTKNQIESNYPYVATTRDSLDIVESGKTPKRYFSEWLEKQVTAPERLLYGVQALENEGLDGYLIFEEDHVYYTAIAGIDGAVTSPTIYKFHWRGEKTQCFFADGQAENLFVTDSW